MKNVNKIELTARKRQSGATTELVAKLYRDGDSILIVENPMMKNIIESGYISPNNVDRLKDRIIFKNCIGYEESLDKYSNWYLDVVSPEHMFDLVKLAIEKNKTLIGHYLDMGEK
jgi:hypothetical protein